MDESGSNTAMTRLFARAPRGERAFGYRPHQRGNNITIVSAMGSDGIVASMTLEGYIDGNAFLAADHLVAKP
ncbi:hypothetical protein [Candidatus Uabimicrobium sp. HlEnr_7]|uniref:hypothetical protein n=1 Tax=Candidatus Uabimicrobium helgolandensis TaxID=3095367 RepID=UPI003557D8E0